MIIRSYLHKRNGGKFQARFYSVDRNPKQKYLALGTSDPAVARQILAEKERMIQAGDWDPWTEAAPEAGLFVSTAVERFLEAKAQYVRLTTVKAYKGVLEAFANALPAGTLAEHVTAKQCKVWYERPSLSKTSRASYARTLKIFFAWAAEKKLVRVNPLVKEKLPETPGKVPVYFKQDQFRHLLRTIDAYATIMESGVDLSEMLEDAFGLELERSKHAGIQEGQVRWMIDLVTVACGTGMRSGELRSMRWDWVNLSERTIHIQDTPDFTPKNGDERVIPIRGDALEALRRLDSGAVDSLVFPGQHGAKMDKDYLGKRFRFFRDLAKLPKKLNVHSCRHTYASWLVQKGVDLYRVKDLCGHKSIKMTTRYAHLAPKNHADAVELAFGN